MTKQGRCYKLVQVLILDMLYLVAFGCYKFWQGLLKIEGQVFQNWVTLLQGRESNFKVRSLSKSREVTICKDLPQFVFMGRIQMRGMVQCNKFCYLNPWFSSDLGTTWKNKRVLQLSERKNTTCTSNTSA